MSARQQLLRRRSFVLHNIDWKTYLRLLRAFEEQPGYRLAYDRGDWKSCHQDSNMTWTTDSWVD